MKSIYIPKEPFCLNENHCLTSVTGLSLSPLPLAPAPATHHAHTPFPCYRQELAHSRVELAFGKCV